jgi:hypothetical protein
VSNCGHGALVQSRGSGTKLEKALPQKHAPQRGLPLQRGEDRVPGVAARGGQSHNREANMAREGRGTNVRCRSRRISSRLPQKQ